MRHFLRDSQILTPQAWRGIACALVSGWKLPEMILDGSKARHTNTAAGPTNCQEGTMLSNDLAARVAVYQAATGHTQEQAIERLLDIALVTWETDPYYMPERVCGRVRPVRTG